MGAQNEHYLQEIARLTQALDTAKKDYQLVERMHSGIAQHNYDTWRVLQRLNIADLVREEMGALYSDKSPTEAVQRVDGDEADNRSLEEHNGRMKAYREFYEDDCLWES